MSSKRWLTIWLIISGFLFCVIAISVYKVDPFFHYHKPETEHYFYVLDNERSQNDGICKHFDYNALITGSSMTENFKTSELDRLFGVNSIKVCFFGSSFKEVDENVRVALSHNPNVQMVVRGLDYKQIINDKDEMKFEEDSYPTYLYDDNPLNDIKYLFNRDVVFERVYPMISLHESGITSFDDYSRWQDGCSFGPEYAISGGNPIVYGSNPVHLSNAEKEIVYGNVYQNIVSIAESYPNVEFYYFIPPYSIVWWSNKYSDGTIYQQIEAEQVLIESILDHANIKLFSFNNRTDITTDLYNYKDYVHYGEWINSEILTCMKEGNCQITKDNYIDYLNSELDFYTSYNY